MDAPSLDHSTAANVPRWFIATFEDGKASPAAALVYELDLRRALEAAGVEFIAENGGGAGVRFEPKPE